MRRRHAFTMIELVIVIAIILILLGLVIVGMKYVGASSKKGTAKVTLENLRSMYAAYDATVKTKPRTQIWTNAGDPQGTLTAVAGDLWSSIAVAPSGTRNLPNKATV